MSTSNLSISSKGYPVFNDKYYIINSLGTGNTSKVYLVKTIQEPSQMFALKIIKEEFLAREKALKQVEQEIKIMGAMKHKHVVQIEGYGDDGVVKKQSGRMIKNIVYILMEYICGGILFDVCQTHGRLGEDIGRYFFNQILDVMEYMQNQGVVHRDLKLENILIDDNLDLNIADFGFATYKNIQRLSSYRGTATYMAPEIKEGRTYNGKKVDIFSSGVILFIIVQGIFPFKQAKKDDYFYSMIVEERFEQYWSKVNGHLFSEEFKDFILKMFSYDPQQRPNIQEMREHPWMQNKMTTLQQKALLREKMDNAILATQDSSKSN